MVGNSTLNWQGANRDHWNGSTNFATTFMFSSGFEQRLKSKIAAPGRHQEPHCKSMVSEMKRGEPKTEIYSQSSPSTQILPLPQLSTPRPLSCQLTSSDPSATTCLDKSAYAQQNGRALSCLCDRWKSNQLQDADMPPEKL